MKKLIYVFASASIKPGSVQKKVISQIRAINTTGNSCKGLFFTTENVDNVRLAEADFIQVEKIEGGLFRSSKQRTAYHKAVFDYFQKKSTDFDFIYYRYPGAHKYLLLLLKNLGRKVFFEHLTAETKEIKLYSSENAFKWNVSSILSYLEFYILPLFREWYFGAKIRKKAAFGICNSEDIATYEKQMAGGTYPTLVVGDAVNTNDYKIKANTELEDEFRMVFLKGAATQADFNGIDRLLKGMAAYRGSIKLKLYLRGRNLKSETELAADLGISNMLDIGEHIDKEKADLLFDSMHLGISALAVHRKGLKSTTTIKSREYFARGLPFIFAYIDPDLSENTEALKYCYQIPANEDKVDINGIINWYSRCISQENYGVKMHQFADLQLDYKVKMEKLKEFLTNNNPKIN